MHFDQTPSPIKTLKIHQKDVLSIYIHNYNIGRVIFFQSDQFKEKNYHDAKCLSKSPYREQVPGKCTENSICSGVSTLKHEQTINCQRQRGKPP